MTNYKYYNHFHKYCHNITEIYPNLFIGSERQVVQALKDKHKFDVLIPLDRLDGEAMDYISPEKIQIFYFPCPDYGVLSERNLAYLVTQIISFLKQKKRVVLFCLEGHGRTGYVTACVIGKLGVKNPVQFLRTKYCNKIIETASQMTEVAKYLGIDLSKEIKDIETKNVCNWMRRQISQLLYGPLPAGSKRDAYLYGMNYDELYEMCLIYGILGNDKEDEENEEIELAEKFYSKTPNIFLDDNTIYTTDSK